MITVIITSIIIIIITSYSSKDTHGYTQVQQYLNINREIRMKFTNEKGKGEKSDIKKGKISK